MSGATKKFIFSFIILFFFGFSFYVKAINMDALSEMNHQAESFANSANLETNANENSLSETIASLIKTFLGLLGIIFIVLVIWAGYNWMTASGNDEKVSKAKKTLYQAIIGLLITVSAYAITYFVFNALD